MAGLLALLPGPSQARRVPPRTIGIFQETSLPQLNSTREGFLKALEEAGFQEGVDFRVELQNPQGHGFSTRAMVDKFLTDRVDLLCILSTAPPEEILHLVQGIPVIFVGVLDPQKVEAGGFPFPPDKRATGVVGVAPVDTALGFIEGVLPQAKRLGVLWAPLDRESTFYVKLLKRAAREKGAKLLAWPVYHRSEVANAVRGLLDQGVDAIYQVPNPVVYPAFGTLVRMAAARRVPVFTSQLELVDEGACAAIGQDFFPLGHRAGQMAARVLQGQDPGRIPPQVVRKVEVHLNLKAAREQMALFPRSVIRKAQRVIR